MERDPSRTAVGEGVTAVGEGVTAVGEGVTAVGEGVTEKVWYEAHQSLK
jgi:hypothetical protein